MAEEEMKSAASKRYGDKKEAPKGETKPKEHEEKPNGEKEGRSSKMEEMRKRHEAEHRDMHGSHKEAMRKMFARHEQEYSQTMAAPEGEAESQGEGAPAQAA
jgi:hypothetical protein